MSQMKIADRNRIEFLIALGWPLPKFAADIGRIPQPSKTNCLNAESAMTRDTDVQTESAPASMNACAKHSPHTEKSCGCFESCPEKTPFSSNITSISEIFPNFQGFRYCTTTAVLTSRIPSGALNARTILPFSRCHSAVIRPLGVGTTPLACETDAGGEGSKTNVS